MNEWTPNPGRRWHNRYSHLGTDPVPIERYISEDFFRNERDKIFRKTWLLLGRGQQIPSPGDYFTYEIPLLDTSVLITRDNDGAIHAFHNMCSHRGSKIALSDKGCAKRLVCPYHNWTYGLSGKLIGVAGESGFFELDKGALGLTRIRCESWAGFIFVNFDDQSTETLEEYLGPTGQRLKDFVFDDYPVHYRYSIDLNANWKIFLDAFQEVYHVPAAHPETLNTVFTGKANPLCHVVDVDAYEKHRSITMYMNETHKWSPMQVLMGERMASALPPGMQLKDAPGLNPSRSPYWANELNGLFPHSFVNIIPPGYFTLSIWPIKVDQTRFVVNGYYPKAERASHRFCQEYNNIAGWLDTLGQDVALCEQIQKVIRSGAKTHFYLSDEEVAIRHANKVIDDMVSAD